MLYSGSNVRANWGCDNPSRATCPSPDRNLVRQQCFWPRILCSIALLQAKAQASASTAPMRAVLVRVVLPSSLHHHNIVSTQPCTSRLQLQLHAWLHVLLSLLCVQTRCRVDALDEQLFNCNLELLDLCLELATLVGRDRACNHLCRNCCRRVLFATVCVCVCVTHPPAVDHIPVETRRMPCLVLPWMARTHMARSVHRDVCVCVLWIFLCMCCAYMTIHHVSYLVLCKQWQVQHNLDGLSICCHHHKLRYTTVECLGCCVWHE